ncbi:hypothetical protein ID866_8281 [Astraeus odoratus]|nr:hypothetical protein ID866_8281 [Astraeus odoratus]
MSTGQEKATYEFGSRAAGDLRGALRANLEDADGSYADEGAIYLGDLVAALDDAVGTLFGDASVEAGTRVEGASNGEGGEGSDGEDLGEHG